MKLTIGSFGFAGWARLLHLELEVVEIEGAVMTETYRESFVLGSGEPQGQFLILRRLVT